MFKHGIKAAQDIAFDDVLRADPDKILMNVTQYRLLGVIRQLGDLCLHASAIFEKLSCDTKKMNDRATKVAEDISLVQADIIEMKKKISEIPPEDCIDINDDGSFDDLWPQPEHDLFTKDKRPEHVTAYYKDCEPPPNLSLLNKFVKSGEDMQKKYSNPRFFFREWVKEEQGRSEWRKMKHAVKRKRQRQAITKALSLHRSPSAPSATPKGDAIGSPPNSALPTSPNPSTKPKVKSTVSLSISSPVKFCVYCGRGTKKASRKICKGCNKPFPGEEADTIERAGQPIMTPTPGGVIPAAPPPPPLPMMTPRPGNDAGPPVPQTPGHPATTATATTPGPPALAPALGSPPAPPLPPGLAVPPPPPPNSALPPPPPPALTVKAGGASLLDALANFKKTNLKPKPKPAAKKSKGSILDEIRGFRNKKSLRKPRNKRKPSASSQAEPMCQTVMDIMEARRNIVASDDEDSWSSSGSDW